MELKTKAVYVAALLACSLIASSEAVTCYKCNSALESGCSDPFKSARIETCTGATCVKAFGSAEGQSVMIRDCLPNRAPKDECREHSVSGSKGIACTCSSDLCNSAKTIIPSEWLLAVVGVLSMSAVIRN